VVEVRDGLRRTIDRMRAIADPMVPTGRVSGEAGCGGGDFIQIGDDFFTLFRRAGLEPSSDVLDVGCGFGRMARPMAGWLRGRYEGFDVAPEPIEWCRSRIARRHPNFAFTLLDVANDVYNPEGSVSAGAVRFPYGDDCFDFALLTSVFTHLVAADLLRYLDELARVVRPGGTVFATYFLLDPEAELALSEGRAWRPMPDRETDPELGEYRLADRTAPAAAVAYSREAVEGAHSRRGLDVEAVWLGAWSGRAAGVTAHDVVVSRVRAPTR
jgi:SAM-dependent methyltransferase